MAWGLNRAVWVTGRGPRWAETPVFEHALHLDIALLVWVQETLGPGARGVMEVLSDLKWSLPILLLVVLGLWTRGGRAGRAAVVGALALVLVSDQLSSSVLKPAFGRARPSGHGLSFPSSHATNVFAQAAFWGRLYPRTLGALVALAVAVGVSRIYLNKHFPSDVLGGAVIGATVGWVWADLFRKRYAQWWTSIRARWRGERDLFEGSEGASAGSVADADTQKQNELD